MAAKSEKPVMLGARISPRAQYGLRLLARVQGRTIADAVEWSINLAMRTTRVGASVMETRLFRIVDDVWSLESEPRQIEYLDAHAPELLDFEQRSAWGLVKRCKELWEETHYAYIQKNEDEPPDKVAVDEKDADFSEKEPRFDLIEKHWEAVRRVGVELVQAGELETYYTLDDIISGKALENAGLAP